MKSHNARAFVIYPRLPVQAPAIHSDDVRRSPAARLKEAVSLARALDLNIIGSGIVTVAKARPATLIGAGKVDELAGQVRADDIELVIVDATLSPVQQRNLERAWYTKVLDRTGLILEIFADRAKTKEGRLQVELAQLTYQRSRLVRSWTHLERQRGGVGFVGGPGETQIEADRRLTQESITALHRELESVKRTRALHREARARVSYPIVALVGYTNAGKSSLFNRLTDAKAVSEDMLFATLDPAMRRLKLPHGATAILSDTVGFVSDLPTHLVAAFRATLEEVTNADLIIHVRDISHPDTRAQAADVEAVLDLLWGEARTAPVIEVMNKIDNLGPAARAQLDTSSDEPVSGPVCVSALTGQGCDHLLEVIETSLSATSTTRDVEIASERGRDINWIYENCEVLERHQSEDGAVKLKVRIPASQLEQFERRISTPESAA